MGYYRILGSCVGLICLSDDLFVSPSRSAMATHLNLTPKVIFSIVSPLLLCGHLKPKSQNNTRWLESSNCSCRATIQRRMRI